MNLKYKDLQGMIATITHGLKLNNENNRLDGYISMLETLSLHEVTPTMIIKYKTFKTTRELEDFQKENIIGVINVTPIYNNFAKIENQDIVEVSEPYVMVTYYDIEKEEQKC